MADPVTATAAAALPGITGLGIRQLLNQLLAGLGTAGTTVALQSALDATRAGTPQITTGTQSKFAVTPQDTLGLFQAYNAEAYRRAALKRLGQPTEEMPSFPSFLADIENRLERQMQGATDRKISEQRVVGELAALPATAQMAGTLGQSSNKVLESALSKVLASTGGMSPAVAEIAKVQTPRI